MLPDLCPCRHRARRHLGVPHGRPHLQVSTIRMCVPMWVGGWVLMCLCVRTCVSTSYYQPRLRYRQCMHLDTPPVWQVAPSSISSPALQNFYALPFRQYVGLELSSVRIEEVG